MAHWPRITPADMVRAGLLVTLLLALMGCGRLGIGGGGGWRSQAQNTFDGHYFRGSARTNGDDRQAFVSTVSSPEKSVKGAIEAAAYYATKHCIETYGTSDIDWDVGPDRAPEDFGAVSGSLSLSGRCRDV